MAGINNTFNVLGVFGWAFYNTWWIVLPTGVYYIFKILARDFLAMRSAVGWHRTRQWIYLEIIPPKDIEKGPQVFESVLHGITGYTTTFNTFDIWVDGAYTQDRFSLELVGEEGRARFIVRIQKKYKSLLEAHVYAQYPDAEIIEIEDYTLKFPKLIPNKKWEMYGADFELTRPWPYPIKTYDKFEESITGTMIDPMAAMVEMVGALPPNQHIWMQYAIEPLQEKWSGLRQDQKDLLNKLKGREEAPGLTTGQHFWDVIKNLGAGLFGPVEFAKVEKKEQQPLEFRLSPIEKEILKGVEDKVGRYLFNVKMRLLVVGHKENFNKDSFISGFYGAIKQFNDMNYNQFKTQDYSKTYGKIFFIKATASYRKRRIYRRYKDRDFDGVKVILTSKEMATIYHFPDMGVKSPSVPRVASKLGSAPPNLPVR